RQTLEAVNGVTQAELDWTSPGLTNTIGTLLYHSVLARDAVPQPGSWSRIAFPCGTWRHHSTALSGGKALTAPEPDESGIRIASPTPEDIARFQPGHVPTGGAVRTPPRRS